MNSYGKGRSIRPAQAVTWISLVCLLLSSSQAAETIQVKPSKVIRTISNPPLGINMNYLRDDNNNRKDARPIQQTLKEMNVGWIRYPGGEKSDWHFWSKTPFTRPEPQVYGWYTGQTKDILDFDEYMAYVREIGAEPYVVVAYDSYANTEKTKDQFLTNAVEWVRYANIKKKYGVRYWEIGNENWHNKTGTPEELSEIVVEFAQKMKAVDPNIKVGASGSTDAWWRDFLPKAAKHIDFLVVSGYPCWNWKGFDYYRKHTRINLISPASTAIDAIKKYAPESEQERLSVVVAELNSMDWSKDGWPNRNNLGHALVTFEICGQILLHEKIAFGMLWNTRWMEDDNPQEIWYALDPSNEILPAGRAVAVWTQFLLDQMVSITEMDRVVTFASYRPSTGALNLFFINKDNVQHSVDVNIEASERYGTAYLYRFHGKGPDDMSPSWSRLSDVNVRNNRFPLVLSHTSLTVVSLGL
jgi:alpha-L-arabinofuranosidase